jgi:hypothetical protein
MTTRHALRAAVLGCVAAAGVVGAHVLDYAVVVHDHAHRSAVLHHTGHAYLSSAVTAAIVAAVAGALASGLVGFQSGRKGRDARLSWRHVALRVAAAQGVGFVLLEGAERVSAHVSPTSLDVRLLVVGVALQLVLGCLAAGLLVLMERAGRAAGRALRTAPSPRVAALGFPLPSPSSSPRRVVVGGRAARGPPETPL